MTLKHENDFDEGSFKMMSMICKIFAWITDFVKIQKIFIFSIFLG